MDMTIIIPVYNVEEYLPVCIDSLMHQDKLRLEIILINDGSTDHSGEIAEQYAKQDSRIKVIHRENKGASAARNVGLDLAKGEYIAFLDSDDWVIENSLSELYRQAIKYQVDIVMGNLLYIHQDKIINGPYKPVPKEFKHIVLSGKEGFIQLIQDRSYRPMQFNYIYRRGFLEKIHARFEEGIMHEDELWMPIVLCKAKTMVIADIDFYYYRQREGSVMQSTRTTRRLDSYFKVTDKLMEFADRFDFSGNDGELKSWLYVNIFWLYSWAFRLLPNYKDSSYLIPMHHLDRFWRDCLKMMPEPQKMSKKYYSIAEVGLKKYTDWRISEFVATIPSQIHSGKKLMLIYNVIQNEDLTLKIEDIPVDWLITTDRLYFQQADAVVFYLPELYREMENDMEKPTGQIWINRYVETETQHQWMDDQEIRDVFDLWVNQSQDVDRKEHPIVSLCRKVDEMICKQKHGSI